MAKHNSHSEIGAFIPVNLDEIEFVNRPYTPEQMKSEEKSSFSEKEFMIKIDNESLHKAIKKYNEERDQYLGSEGNARFFLLDKSSETIYASKVLVALAYLISIKSNLSYEQYKEQNPNFHGKKEFTYKIIKKFAEDNSGYEAIELSSENKKKYNKSLDNEFADIDKLSTEFNGYDKESFVKHRVNQGKFRKLLLSTYGDCALCGLDLTDVLIASHIKAWSDSTPSERTNINNALLLCANHDRLFDRHLISFDNKGHILISNRISDSDKRLLNINDSDSLHIDMNEKRRAFMAFHRAKFEGKEPK